jgi:N-acetylmuramoyl-L-alanine amidase
MDKWKKVVAGLMLLGLLLAWPAVATAMGITLNGQPADHAIPVMVSEGRTLASMRPFFEALGAQVDYLPGEKQVVATSVDKQIKLDLADDEVWVNGELMDWDVVAKVVSGRTYVPVRFLAESLGGTVGWNEATKTVDVCLPNVTAQIAEACAPIIPYTDQDLELLARLIQAEAGSEPLEGMLAVGAVVVNRVLDPCFPDTIQGVIYQPRQFTPVGNHRFNAPISERAWEAARAALHGQDPVEGALFFFNPARAKGSFLFTRPVIAEIGNHRFTN